MTVNNKGFTLTEIIVVIAIFFILVTMSWVAFQRLQPSLQLGAVCSDLVSDLRYVQQLAISEQVNYGIDFSTTTNSYAIYRFATTTEQLSTKNLPAEISFCDLSGLTANTQAIFNPYGAVLNAGSICLQNRNNQTKIVDIRPSGFVRVQH